MKFNFGTGLILFFSLWAIGILFLVYKSSQQRVDLVANDYYNKEIAYQSQIDKEKNANRLSQPLQVDYDKSRSAVVIQFPKNSDNRLPAGTIHFFKPDNASLDFTVKINCDSSMRLYVSSEKMKTGMWRAQVDWNCGSDSFYEEKEILIN